MQINQAGSHDQPAGVNNSRGSFRRNAALYRSDPVTLYANIKLPTPAARRNNRAPLITKSNCNSNSP
jgi:hypothetical protein